MIRWPDLSRLLLACGLLASPAWAAPGTAPPAGLRETSQNTHAIVGAKIVVSPDRTIAAGTLVVRDGVIVEIGERVTPPADAQVWNAAGKTLYPGLIDSFSEMSTKASRATLPEGAGAAYWNANVVPHVRADSLYTLDSGLNRKLRSNGVVARLVAPSSGVIKGISTLVSTGDDAVKQAILKDQVALHAKLTSRGTEGGYPTSPMGALTLVRQAFYDAGWYGQAWDAFRQHPELPRPERSDALASLGTYLGRKPPVVIDADNELYFLRADRVAREFGLNLIVRGSGLEYRRLDLIKATGRPLIVPLDFPKAPNVGTPEGAMNVSLQRLMHWDLAPENPARLAAAGIKFALTGHGLRDQGALLAAVRKAVKRGLPADTALRALTVTPAELLDVADRLGTLEVGKAANIVVASGPLFESKTRVLETWVDGRRFEIEAEPLADVRGQWKLEIAGADGANQELLLELTGQPKKLSGKITRGEKSTSLSSVMLDDLQLTASFKGQPLGLEGVVRLSGTVASPAKAPQEQLSWLGVVAWADGSQSTCTATRVSGPKNEAEEAKAEPSKAADKKPDEAPAEKKDAPKPDDKPAPKVDAPAKTDDMPPPKGVDEKPQTPTDPKAAEASAGAPAISPVNFPLGESGRSAPPEQPKAVLFRGATIWTSGPQGRLEQADLLIEAGKVRAVGPRLEVPAGALVIDAAGKHISPGIIDCHSHVATDGAVNEVGQTITAEVRIGDFVDPNDMNIYRQLAGGVTTSNILHGSANTIGGQNQVLKFRWGAGPEEMKLAEAPPGIKFALGENVKQSNRPERGGGGAARYPQTRMGVEQLVLDSLQTARHYRQQWDQWNRTKAGLPPRVDLELEALAEVAEGKRLIHCHSYRQDEILALMRTCEGLGIKIATFQHILEGYKVADVMARHGVGGSSFSDWWAYKFEVWDAIPYNGALLHNAGVVVSFNSDNAELARRLNLEAAKAVKYGDVPPVEALKFVTLNPAKQLKIDALVGSLEPGKDADLVVWNGSPLSTYSRCEQTWVDGRRYFDREEDRAQRAETGKLRAALVQRILTSGEPVENPDDEPADSWPRDDIYCEHGHP